MATVSPRLWPRSLRDLLAYPQSIGVHERWARRGRHQWHRDRRGPPARSAREWGVQHVFGYPGDGINGLLAAWGRADNRATLRPGPARGDGGLRGGRLREVQRPARGLHGDAGPGAIHLLNGLYDAKLDHVPVVAIVGQTGAQRDGRVLPAGGRPAACSRTSRSDYVQMVTVPEQLPNLLDRAIRIASAHRAPTRVIIPVRRARARVLAPAHAFKRCRRASGSTGRRCTRRRRGPPRRRPAQRRREGRDAGRPGRPGLRDELDRGRRPAGRRRGQGAAGQGRAARRRCPG